MSEENKAKPNDLSAKDVVDIGKDSVKQAAVWVIAAALTKGVRDLASRYLMKKTKS